MFKRVISLVVIVLLLSLANTAVASASDRVRVGLLRLTDNSNAIEVSISGAHAIYEDGNALLQVDGANRYRFSNGAGGLTVTDDGGVFGSAYNLTFTAKQTVLVPLDGSALKINNTPATGWFMLGQTDKGKLIPIAIMDRETYLRGVVPREMSPSRPIEALKAQAVAARTYSIEQMNHHAAAGYDICDTPNCQVYGGVSAHHANSDRAVAETAGLCVAYQGAPAQTFYHASSGGYIENSEDIFSAELPYIKAAADPYSLTDSYRWTADFSLANLTNNLIEQGYAVGNVARLTVDKRLPSGRVVALTIYGDAGQVTLEKEKIRAAFGYSALKSLLFWFGEVANYFGIAPDDAVRLAEGTHYVVAADGVVRQLATTSFAVAGAPAATNDDMITGDFTVSGRGWGHGLGMSQVGAQQMADDGLDFRQILTFYYPNTEIIDVEQLTDEDN